MDIIGDRWTLLVIRDLATGKARFKELAASPERIPTNILSDRLNRLMEEQLIIQVPIAEGSKRLAYHLTSKGKALLPVLSAMHEWGLKWMPGTMPGIPATSLP